MGRALYQAIATVPTHHRAVFAHLAFKGRVMREDHDRGLVANGRWLANRSISRRFGRVR